MSGQSRAIAVGVFVTLLWSSSWLLVRWGDARSIDPVSFAAMRYVIAAVVLLAVTMTRHRPAAAAALRDRATLRQVAALGVVYYAITQAAQFVAIVRQPAASTSLVLSATVIVVAVLSRRSLGEAATRSTLLGATVVVIGSLTYLRGDLGFSVAGMTAALVALAGNSTATLLGRGVNRHGAQHPVVITAISMTIGATALVAFAIGSHRPLPRPDVATALIVGWMALVNTAVAFSLWSWVLRHVTAAEASSINNLMLVEIAALGWIFLDEPLGPFDVLGILVVLSGVLITQRPMLRSRAAWSRPVHERGDRSTAPMSRLPRDRLISGAASVRVAREEQTMSTQTPHDGAEQLALPPVVDHRTWEAALAELRTREKAATRELDAIAAARRRLPMVELPDYVLDGADGPVRLVDVFEGKRQLIVYHHMWFPGEEWQCPGCTGFTSQFTRLEFLEDYDARFVIVTQGPIDEALAYKARVGNKMTWYSTANSPFGADMGAPPDGGFQVNVFLRDGDTVYRTYNTQGRGTEQLSHTFPLIDLLPYGRQEDWQDSPAGWPQAPTYSRWQSSDAFARYAEHA